MYNAECIAIKDIKPGLKNINVIFIVLEVCSKLSITNDCMFFSFVYMLQIVFIFWFQTGGRGYSHQGESGGAQLQGWRPYG